MVSQQQDLKDLSNEIMHKLVTNSHQVDTDVVEGKAQIHVETPQGHKFLVTIEPDTDTEE